MQHVSNGDRLAPQLDRLEHRLRRTQAALGLVCLTGLCAALAGVVAQSSTGEPAKEIRTQRLVVVDDQGVPRVILGQDAPDTQRRSRSAGLWILDRHGHERGGLGTFDDDSVSFALDAPVGVGHPMRDRAGMFVGADGSSYVMLLDNQTRGVARLHSDGTGAGGVQVFRWDMDNRKIHVRTLTFDGEEREVRDMSD